MSDLKCVGKMEQLVSGTAEFDQVVARLEALADFLQQNNRFPNDEELDRFIG